MTIATGAKWADLAEKDEDTRIRIIGETAAAGKIVGVCLEKDEAEKIARYVRKITERYATVVGHRAYGVGSRRLYLWALHRAWEVREGSLHD